MHNSIRMTVLLTAIPILFLCACAAPQMDLPNSIGPDIASRTGVKPAWSGVDSTDTRDGKSLRAAAAVALPNPLNEVDAVAIALDASPDIALMLAQTDALRSEAIEIATPQNPVLNFSSGVPLDSLGVVPIFAMLMVQIDELWKQPIRSESARNSYEAALLSLGAQAVALANETRSLWHELFLREQECALATNDIALTEPLLTWARDRVRAGEGDENGVAKAQSVFADALRRSAQATEMRDFAKLSLMELLGRAEASVEWSVGSADPTAMHTIHAALTDESKLLDRLAQSRLDVRAAQAREKAAHGRLVLAQRSRLGQIQLGAGWERSLENQQALGVAANVELPIFNIGSMRIAKALADYRAATIAAEDIRQKAIIELRSSLVQAISAQKRHDFSESTQVNPAIETVQRINKAMQAGEMAERDSLDAQHSLTLARLQLTGLERERRSSRLALSKAAGFLPIEEFP